MKDIVKKTLMDWRFWVAVGLIVAGVFLYNTGKKNGLTVPPDDAPYPNSSDKTTEENAAFAQWAKTIGNSWVEKANSFFSSWTSNIYYGGMRDLIYAMNAMSDEEIVYIGNTYSRRYFKTGTFLTRVYQYKLYFTSEYDSVLNRLIKNKVK
jgi:hypothetical protein